MYLFVFPFQIYTVLNVPVWTGKSSLDLGSYAIFNFQNSIIKTAAYCQNSHAVSLNLFTYVVYCIFTSA